MHNLETRTQGLQRLEEATRCLFEKLGDHAPEALITSLRCVAEVNVTTVFSTARVVLEPSRIETIKMVLEAAKLEEST